MAFPIIMISPPHVRFFSGLSTEVSRPTMNENRSKPRVSPEALQALYSHLADEVDFYHFCRLRLLKQLRMAEAAEIMAS